MGEHHLKPTSCKELREFLAPIKRAHRTPQSPSFLGLSISLAISLLLSANRDASVVFITMNKLSSSLCSLIDLRTRTTEYRLAFSDITWYSPSAMCFPRLANTSSRVEMISVRRPRKGVGDNSRGRRVML